MKLLIAKSNEEEIYIDTKMLNRHGIINGATGTGKTITVKVLAEKMANAGIPTLITDIKGDLASISECGNLDSVIERVNKLNLNDFNVTAFPTRFWDIYGKNGHLVKAKISSFSESLLSKVLSLTDAQEGIINIVYRISKDENIKLDTFDDLKNILNLMDNNKESLSPIYGNITTQSINTIRRKLLEFENTNGNIFFGNPEFNFEDLMNIDATGKGFVNVLDATELVKDYKLYGAFMLWMLNTLFDKLPEVGDAEKPKLVLFIDEAHMLFDDMNNDMQKKITQIVKLIRSKGIGLFFISQSPSDIPESISTQLGNRIEHNLKAYTPQELKAVKVAANSFRVNPEFDTEKAIIELKTGEALISTILETGEPSIVKRAFIVPPQSKMGTVNESTRQSIISSSPFIYKYQKIEEPTTYPQEQQSSEIKKSSIFDTINKEKAVNETPTQTIKQSKIEVKTKKEKTVLDSMTKKVINKAENKIATKIVNSIFKLFK